MVDNGNGIYTVDSLYLRPDSTAVYLVVEGNEVAIIETGHSRSLVQVLHSLSELGLTINSVKYVVVTHIHLDHAGGVGEYMGSFPQAKLVVHPKGARHMHDPRMLETSAINVYGQRFVEENYGHLQGVPYERMIITEEVTTLDLNGRQLICYNAPGHANHHNVIYDPKSKGVFSGDTLGISYPQLRRDERAFVFPATTPVNFQPQWMKESIKKIAALNPQKIYLTHYGMVTNVSECMVALPVLIDGYLELTAKCQGLEFSETVLAAELGEYLVQHIWHFGLELSREEILAIIGLDVAINAQGLRHWAQAQNK